MVLNLNLTLLNIFRIRKTLTFPLFKQITHSQSNKSDLRIQGQLIYTLRANMNECNSCNHLRPKKEILEHCSNSCNLERVQLHIDDIDDDGKEKKDESLDKKTYLFWFSNEHANFISAEMEALFTLFNIDKNVLKTSITFGPFLIINSLKANEVKLILSRSILAHSCFELWSSAQSMKQLHSNLNQKLALFDPHSLNSFKITVESYGKRVSHQFKLSIINEFSYLPLDGDVELKSPEVNFYCIQFYGLDTVNIPDEPLSVYFGRWVGDGQRDLISKISLKKRKFIGNTSMDALLSLLMANLGLVSKNRVVLDPFVGTGSLIIAAAVMGGYVLGTDIDFLMLHGKTRPTRAFTEKRGSDESVLANMKQYGVESKYLDVLIADSSRPLWRDDFKFDVIITDPPYGVRESTERVGSEVEVTKIAEEHLCRHYPKKTTYALSDIFIDLLNFSAAQLSLGGRLVCWIPVSRPNYNEDHLPKHPSFRLISNSEQVFTPYVGRRLLVYEKICEPPEGTLATCDRYSPMYKIKFLEENDDRETRRERKFNAAKKLGKTSKRGQIFSQTKN